MGSYKKSAISILVNPKGQILLQLRDNKPWIHCPNQWGFIGGGIEEGETEFEAIKRETKEEIGLEIDNFQYIDCFYDQENKIDVSLFIGALDISAEEIKVGEGQGVKFFYPSEINNLKMIKILKEMINKHSDKIFDRTYRVD